MFNFEHNLTFWLISWTDFISAVLMDMHCQYQRQASAGLAVEKKKQPSASVLTVYYIISWDTVTRMIL